MKHGDRGTQWNEQPAKEMILPDLAGKSMVVTGAARGIGRATVEALLANQARVFGLDQIPADLRQEGFTPILCDLASPKEIERAFAEIATRVSALDGVVNVAGIDPKIPLEAVTVEAWDHLLDVNLRAGFLVIQRALPLLRRGAAPAIVNVSSINYRLGIPGRAPYSVSKAGLLGLTTGLSRDLGREHIRINTVSPGWVFTERQIADYFSGEVAAKNLAHVAERQAIPLKILAGDVANHILFYLSDVSRASTGHNCVVDSGWILE